MPYDYKPFPYVAPPGLTAPEPRHPVVIVGAGPIGLAAALELANHGVRSDILDDNNVVSVGSRAICWSKRSLEILDRLGVGTACVEIARKSLGRDGKTVGKEGLKPHGIRFGAFRPPLSHPAAEAVRGCWGG